MKAQLSAEMLILLVILLGVAVILASTMMQSAGKASQKIEQKTDAILAKADAGSGGAAGDPCASGADCASGSCDSYLRTCN
jgi:Tfp pilus assembly protein PilV